METLRACALLARVPSLTAEHVLAAVARAGSLEDAASVLEARSELDQTKLDADLRWIERSGAKLVPCTSEHYPPQLARTVGAPPVLYVMGRTELLAEPQIAMVGTRNPTPSGKRTALELAAFFARSGLIVTSGLALGIDAASHEGALKGQGPTIAVCGNGLDSVYPRQNRALAERIREHGAIVSEFAPGTKPLRYHFPRRNRIISGLSLGTLVVEAAEGSGSLITARCALEQGREIFAVPGSIHNPMCRGCHQLIRAGATLIERGEEVLQELKFSLRAQSLEAKSSARADSTASGPALDKEYEMLLDALGFEPTGIDAIVARTGFPSESVASMLLILELEGRVAPHVGGRYCRLPEVA
jgi:DNA processing protein